MLAHIEIRTQGPRLVLRLSILLVMVLLGSSLTLRADVEAEQTTSPPNENQTDESPSKAALPHRSDLTERNFVQTFLKDEVHIWRSPLRRSSYSSRAFPKYVVPFALITGALIATDHRTSELLPNTKDQAIWSGRVSQVGAPYTLAGVAVGMYFVGKGIGNSRVRETGILGAAAIAHSQIVTLALKAATQRERPLDFQANGGGGLAFGRGGGSFPSGHASGSFALATVFAYEYGRAHRWVPYASYGMASVVAASRLSAQQHWVSDLFVGSAVGFLIGRYVYKSHHDPRIDGEVSRRADRVIPTFGVTSRTATVAWNW